MKRRTLAIALALTVLVAAEAGLLSRVNHAHHTAAINHAELADASRAVDEAGTAIAAAQAKLRESRRAVGVRDNEAERARIRLNDEAKKLANAKRSLADVNATRAATAASLAALDTCVTGAQKATFVRNAGDSATATNMLKLVQPVCASLATGADPEAAVFPFDFSDPSVLRVGNKYYAYSTNSAIGNLPVITSSDLVHWTIAGNGLPWLPKWATPGSTWAPAVVALGGKYVAYYTAQHAAGRVQCISVAVAETPVGPFIDLSKGPLVCQADLGGSIDPQPFVDEHGQPWLLWKSERGGARRATIWSQPLRADGRALIYAPSPLIQADQDWEDGVVEAPSLVDEHGTLALFYSGNDWNGAAYALGEARCGSPAGPCWKPRQTPVFGSHASVAGPGSATVFASPKGDLWLLYNAYNAAHVGYPASRLLHVARVKVDGDAVTVTPR